jgi:hypothetical protein
MTEHDDDDYEARKERRLHKLGTNDPKCATCPENRWQSLELHHLAGKDHNDTLVILCRNCHRLASDAQRDHPPKQDSADPALEAIGRFLLGLADLLRLIVEKLAEFGRNLIERSRRCDVSAGAPAP